MQTAAGSPLPRSYHTRKTDGMKYAVKDINKLIGEIRSGQPPELPHGIREQHYHDPGLPGFYIRALNSGAASWVVQWKRLGRQKKITLDDVKVVDRDTAVKAGRELLAKVTLGLLDPHEARRERMRANKITLVTVAMLYMEHRTRQGDLRPGTANNWKRYLITGYYFQPLHNCQSMRSPESKSKHGSTTSQSSPGRHRPITAAP
jgi:hypothetical protein